MSIFGCLLLTIWSIDSILTTSAPLEEHLLTDNEKLIQIEIDAETKTLSFACFDANHEALPHCQTEYSIGAKLYVAVQQDLKGKLQLKSKHDRRHHLKLTPIKMTQNADSSFRYYTTTLLKFSDYCFRLKDEVNTVVAFDFQTYCFRVLPDTVARAQQTIFIPNANTLSGQQLREQIENKLVRLARRKASKATSNTNVSVSKTHNHTNMSESSPQAAYNVKVSDADLSVPMVDLSLNVASHNEKNDTRSNSTRNNTINAPERKPVLIGINMAYESRGISMSDSEVQKLLFLIQHIVSKLLIRFDGNFFFVTLPIATNLQRHHFYPSVSERVALIVNKFKQKTQDLQYPFELQYSTSVESAFGGRIILEVPSKKSDNYNDNIPMQYLSKLVDLLLICGPFDVKHPDTVGIMVRYNGTQQCMQKIDSLNEMAKYDALNNIAVEMAKCITNALNISYSTLDIDISLNSKVPESGVAAASITDEYRESTNEKLDSIVFELRMQENECCNIAISENAAFHNIVLNDVVNNGDHREVFVLHTDSITLVPQIPSDAAVLVRDVVFYQDVIDEFWQFIYEPPGNAASEFVHHPKLRSSHHLLYASGEYVSVTYGLWYLCAAWTQISTHHTAGIREPSKLKQERVAKCSDDIYFNANYGLSKAQNDELNAMPKQDLLDLDDSGFLALQILHLSAIWKQIRTLKGDFIADEDAKLGLNSEASQYESVSHSYLQRLKEIEDEYQKQVNVLSEDTVETKHLQNQIELIRKRLKNDEKLEKMYQASLAQFQKKDIDQNMEQYKLLQQRMIDSENQLQRLKNTKMRHQAMLDTLKNHQKYFQVSADGQIQSVAK